MSLDVFLAGFTLKEKPLVALTESELSELLAALKADEMTDTIRASLEWILQFQETTGRPAVPVPRALERDGAG